MLYCSRRVIENHSGAGIPHNLFDTYAHMRSITMRGAFATDRLIFTVTALFKPFKGVNQKLLAIVAQIASMLSTAIKRYH